MVAGLQEVYPHGRCESRFVPGECFGSGGGTSDPFVRDGGGYRDGVVGKRWVLPGDRIEAGQTAITLNRGTDIWVAVYLEETKFKEIYLGQKAQFTLDAYDKLTFEGRVYYIGDNTASEFALVPPNNASGNFTKVTQRIPLKISIDRVEGDDGQKARVKLVSGMSATVKIEKE